MDRTLIAYSFRSARPVERLEAALARVERHYEPLSATPLMREGDAGSTLGLVTWSASDPSCGWPAWASAGGLGVATLHVPTGWSRVIGTVDAADAPVPLARALQADPRRCAELDGPFVVAAVDERSETLTIVNDLVGAGRLYEMAVDDGHVWSNRLGALPLFAGSRPHLDARAWELLAAGGWFMGDATPIAGARKTPAGQMVSARRSGVRRISGSLEPLVAPRQPLALSARVDRVGDQMTDLASSVDDLWDEPIEVSLSGGRDSRVSAAVTLRAGIDARYRTVDTMPGEAAVARGLAERARRPIDHIVHPAAGTDEIGDPMARAAAEHLEHDGMIAPERVRASGAAPDDAAAAPTMAGYGGAIAKGFLYGDRPRLESIRARGPSGPLARLERFFRRKHSAARGEAYEALRAELERTLAAGRELGLEGPALLDWFYLVERLPHKSALGSSSAMTSAFTTPEFIRAAFDLSPEQRCDSVIHDALIERLAPEWRDVPFFARDPATRRMPRVNRPRIWQAAPRALAELIEGGGGWTEMLDPDRMRTIWAGLSTGAGHAHEEQVLERLVWRASFERHLALLGDRATAREPALAGRPT